MVQERAGLRLGHGGESEQNVLFHPRTILTEPTMDLRRIPVARHFAVDNDGIEALILQERAHFLGIHHRYHSGPGAAKNVAFKLQYCFFIFHQEDAAFHGKFAPRHSRLAIQGRCLSGSGQANFDYCPAWFSVARGDVPTMLFDDAVTNAEPQSGPFPDVLGSIKRIENAVGLFYAWP